MSAESQPAALPRMPGPQFLRLVLIGGAVGIPAALVTVAFLWLVHELEHVLWVSLPAALGQDTPPWWLVVALPAVGAVLVWLARARLPGNGGHEPIEGIAVDATPLVHVPGIALAALGSLAFGAVLGPEAPLIALGAATGMVFVGWLKVAAPGDKVLATSGSMAAISALFGGPIVAGAMMLEAGLSLGAALLPALIPGLVAAAIGYTIIVGVGDWSGIPVAELSVPGLPTYSTTRVPDLVVAVLAGAVLAVIVPLVRHLAHRVIASRSRIGMGPVLVLGGLVTGVIAQAVVATGGRYDDVLFSGQFAVGDLVTDPDLRMVALVTAAKALAYAVCLGAGFRGGPVFPAIFVGTGVAVLLGSVVGMSPTVAVAIGAACGMAAFTRLIVTSLVFAALLVGVAGTAALPASVLAAVTAWLGVTVVESRRPAPPLPGH